MSDADRDRMLTEIHATLAVVASRVSDHHETLYGNGHAGLKADVQRMDLEQQHCPARTAYAVDSKQLRAAWAGVLVGAGGVAIAVMTLVAQAIL